MMTERIDKIADETGVHPSDVRRIMDWFEETQIVTYTFPDPDGFHFQYPDPDDMMVDIASWDEGEGKKWPIYMQIEFRDPIRIVSFPHD